MPSMKTYLRYELSETFGVISSPQSNAVFDSTGALAIAGALHCVAVWNLRQGSQVRLLRPEGENAHKGHVTSLALSPDGRTVSAGYSTGLVRLFVLTTGDMAVALNGHRSAVTASRYHPTGALLATGGADTDVVVWDVVAELGLYRLKGHRDGVTDVVFLAVGSEGGGSGMGGLLPRGLASCSKDTLVKIWDLDTQSCVQTIVGHRGEVWSVDVNPSCTRMVTGGSDNQLRVWALGGEGEHAPGGEKGAEAEAEGGADADLVAVYMGSVTRQSNDRALRVRFQSRGGLLGVQSSGKIVEVFRVRPEAEAKKKKKRRLKRHKEKADKAVHQRKAAGAWDEEEGGADGEGGTGGGGAIDSMQGGGVPGLVAGDELEAVTAVRTSHKVKSFDFSPELTKNGTGCRLLLGLHDNSLELWGLEGACTPPESLHTRGKRRRSKAGEGDDADGDGDGGGAAAASSARLATLDIHGHRTDIRAVAVSSDDLLLASASHGLAKVWNVKTCKSIRSVPCGFGLSLAFAPGDRHLLVGTKAGNLQVIDLASGDMVQDYAAHEGAVWSLDVRPDKKGLVTGSADHQVKFWDFEVVEGNLGLVHTRMLKMADDVLCVRYSKHRQADKLLLAVAILDSTVKVFYDDSLKFFLSLYGHKLPVMSMDISDDGALIATGSADKTIKLWGLDFGDCHRSLLAHDDSVMSVRFVRGTHFLFTCSKDRTVKHWDGDRFEKILTLEGHQAEAWALEVSTDGSFVLSGGHDRSLRLWKRGEDMVFLEEEREKEMEGVFEAELDGPGRAGPEGAPRPPGEAQEAAESGLATQRSVESVKAGERLMEALELALHEEEAVRAHAKAAKRAARKGLPLPPPRRPNPLLLNLSVLRYVLRTIQMIRTPELEQALLVLPFDQVEALAKYLARLLARGLEVELCTRCAVFLVRTHQAQIVSTHHMVDVLERLRTHLRQQLEASRDVVGRNMAGLHLLAGMVDDKKNSYLLETEEDRPCGFDTTN